MQMHQCACSSSATGNGSDLGIRQQWLPLFDRYQVDLVLTGHDHGYERSFPVRGADADAGREVATGAVIDTLRPHPVTTTDNGVFDTSQGTVHLVLGCGGADADLDDCGVGTADGQRQAKVFARANRPALTSAPDVCARAAADAVEDATWSARRDTSTGYGIAVFDVDPDPEDFTATPASPSRSTTRPARTRSTRPPAPRARRPPSTPSSRPSPSSAGAPEPAARGRRSSRAPDTVGAWMHW